MYYIILHNTLFLLSSKMGLDLIPRVDGQVVDADTKSVVELYKVVSRISSTANIIAINY